MNQSIECLTAIGFTRLEAEIYAFLVGQRAVTGYRVAQAISKPAANTYKALESLQGKGAVLVDESDARRFSAVPVTELLNRLQKDFNDKKSRAEKVLSQLKGADHDDRIYQLRSPGQVLERAQAMLSQCQHLAFVDAAPRILQELSKGLEEAVRRKVDVVIKAYESISVPGAYIVIRPRGHEITSALPGDLLSLNTDGREHLLALLSSSDDKVFQALWTASPVVSYLLNNGLINEISLTAVMAELARQPTVDSIQSVFTDFRRFHPISSRGPAYQNLLKHLKASPAS